MKVTGRDIAAFLKRPPEGLAAALFFGPNAGLARERAHALAGTVTPDLKDPFRVAHLSLAELRDDPARLADEAAALSMTGGRRVVFVGDSSDALAKTAESLLAQMAAQSSSPPSLVILIAGDLGPRSSLRKLFEGAASAAAIPCYNDDAASLAGFVAGELRAQGLICEGDALNLLVASLGDDREAARRELEKLALYMARPDEDNGGPRHIATADVAAVAGDAAELALDDLAMAVGAGAIVAADGALARAFGAGESPITVLRALARHFERLHRAAGEVAKGESPARALAALRPPVFFKLRSGMEAQLRLWSVGRLAQALMRLAEAEIQCKTTGAPAEAIAMRAALGLASAAKSSVRAR